MDCLNSQVTTVKEVSYLSLQYDTQFIAVMVPAEIAVSHK